MAKMTAADRDEGFRAWLAMNDYLLDCEFLAGDVPGLPADPYSQAGLLVAEQNALERFTSADDALQPVNRAMYDKFVRFIGETFVRSLGGRWTNHAPYADGAYLGVAFPWSDDPLTVPTLFTAALARRTGHEWADVWGYMREDKTRAQ